MNIVSSQTALHRKILFQGKSIKDGSWVQGDLSQDPNLETFTICGWNYFSGGSGSEREPFFVEVHPESVGQFIGITDKNGKEVFEGQLCRVTVWNFDNQKTTATGVIRYDRMGMLTLQIKPHLYDDIFLRVCVAYSFEIEVLGNAFDMAAANPSNEQEIEKTAECPESRYEIIYDYDDGVLEQKNIHETLTGSWTELQDHIREIRADGCYNISANAISE